jgi:hypothetical protein
MADMHLTRELLGAIARGDIPGRILGDTMLAHLKSLCPHCKKELEEFSREREAELQDGSPSPSSEAISAVVNRHLGDLRRGHERARQDVGRLLTLPQDERIARIRRSRTRYRGPQVAWVLLHESRASVTASLPTSCSR